MAKTNTTTVAVSVAGDGFPGAIYSGSVANAAGTPPGSFTLATGFNSIPVPASATGVTVIPPPGSVITKQLKGITGDTGIALSPSNPTFLSFAAGANATLGITASAGETVSLLWS